MLQAKLRNRLPSLLLVPRVDGNGAARGNAGLAALLNIRVVAGACVLDLSALLVGLVGELLDTWVRHSESKIRRLRERFAEGNVAVVVLKEKKWVRKSWLRVQLAHGARTTSR